MLLTVKNIFWCLFLPIVFVSDDFLTYLSLYLLFEITYLFLNIRIIRTWLYFHCFILGIRIFRMGVCIVR